MAHLPHRTPCRDGARRPHQPARRSVRRDPRAVARPALTRRSDRGAPSASPIVNRSPSKAVPSAAAPAPRRWESAALVAILFVALLLRLPHINDSLLLGQVWDS